MRAFVDFHTPPLSTRPLCSRLRHILSSSLLLVNHRPHYHDDTATSGGGATRKSYYAILYIKLYNKQKNSKTHTPASGLVLYQQQRRWDSDQVAGAVEMLDLRRQNQVDHLFRLKEPKVPSTWKSSY